MMCFPYYKYRYLIASISILVVGVVWIFIRSSDEDSAPSSVWETGIKISQGTSTPAAPAVFESLNTESAFAFKHPAARISFLYPKDLRLSTIVEEDGSEIVLLQNPEEGRGVQIILSVFDEPGSVLTIERIKQDIPDLEIRDPQIIQLGEHSGQGIAFLSDNESFAGNSREVWFVFRGRLYQISTYARLDPLLQSILATWKFE